MSHVTQPQIFDRRLLRQRRQRAARSFSQHDFLHRLAAESLLERYADVRVPLLRVLELGCHDGWIAQTLQAQGAQLVATELVPAWLSSLTMPAVVADEEALPFAPGSFDCIISNLNFHSVNDLPGVLAQCHHALAPGGVMLAALLGGETLRELRHCLYQAEHEVMGGVSPRVAPAISLDSAAALLQRAGFALPVADHDVIDVTYPDVFALMRDLRGMGLTNILQERRRGMTARGVFNRMAEVYASRYPAAGGGITARFELIYLHGWAEKPAKA